MRSSSRRIARQPVQLTAPSAVNLLVPADDSFGSRLLLMCNQVLFECLALNLYCLRGEQMALTDVINHRIVSGKDIGHSAAYLCPLC